MLETHDFAVALLVGSDEENILKEEYGISIITLNVPPPPNTKGKLSPRPWSPRLPTGHIEAKININLNSSKLFVVIRKMAWWINMAFQSSP